MRGVVEAGECSVNTVRVNAASAGRTKTSHRAAPTPAHLVAVVVVVVHLQAIGV